ncbi:protein phosphatase CheZ [Luteimonas sp. S4-F44]|uniref:protein phosphatase CheZ n=1 Tax=Luteimonas sp. S4-F44 TaxID=2925842 RepID=UPI001F53937B|nr:protein phosphatase CheZ [Luteimonas sp. S4-F44]UNK43946.1 protein phosphatase CheZ [Luteimonas sp. S4-F44]
MTATATATTDRSQLAGLLHDALEALERGDEAGWRRQVDALAAARARTLVDGLGRLARELAQALDTLPAAPAQGGLDDACARLDHVVTMTEQATHRTLDLIEDSRAHVAQLRAGTLDAAQTATLDALRENLREMALAQSHQDLGGQIIRRVAGIVRGVHEGFGALGLPSADGENDRLRAAGPAVAGLDTGTVGQDDADDLLSRLGL